MRRGLLRGWSAATELRYRIAASSPHPFSSLSLYIYIIYVHISFSPREMEMNLLYYSAVLLPVAYAVSAKLILTKK